MNNLKNEIGLIILGAMLVFFSSLNSDDKNLDSKDASLSLSDNKRQKESTYSKKTKDKNSRLPASINNNDSDQSNNKNNKPTKTTATSLPEGLSKINLKILCLESETCDYPNNDPLEYSLKVYQDISGDIKANSKTWLNKWSNYTRSDQEELISLLKLDSGYVKKEILSLLNNLPIKDSKQYYNTVVSDILNYHDANLVDQAVTYLRKIKDKTNEISIAKDLVNTIKNGSPHVAEAVSKHSLPFMSNQTRPYFADLQKILPKNSPETIQVEAAIIEHDMITSGG